MVPDVLAMPYVDEQWSAIALHPERVSSQASLTGQQPTQIIIRQGAWQGYALDSEAWQFTLQNRIALAQAADEASDKKNAAKNTTKNDAAKAATSDNVLTINAYSALPSLDDVNQQSVVNLVNAGEELPLALFAQQSSQKQSQSSTFNLLQGEFKVKERRSPHINNWLWAAGFAVCALLLNVGYKSAQLFQLSAQQADIEAQIIKQYQQAFPGAKRVRIGTIKSQLSRELSSLGGATEQVGFLSMLAQVQPAFAKVPSLKPESLKFDGKRQELRLQAIADDYQHFEQFKNALALANVEVKQGAQKNQGEQVTGSFSIVSKEGS
jgi:general secretion pathway protein L